MENQLKDLFKKYSIDYCDNQIKNFLKFTDLLLEWNEKFNLTRITDKQEIVVKHYLDSVYPINCFEKNKKVLDIGAGAGFPSIPLKIMREDLDFTLIDSLNKRVNFLNEAINTLNLKNIIAEHNRVEDLKKRDYFDYVVARAVAQLPTLLEYSIPFLKIGGQLIAYKSGDIIQEIEDSKNALKLLNAKIIKQVSYDIEGNSRTLLIIEKFAKTDNKYPRGKNLPKVKPL